MHILCMDKPILISNKRFIDYLSKINMRTSKTAIQDTC